MALSYWSYYLAWMFLSYAVRQPLLLLGAVVFLVLRRFIPDPGALLTGLSRGNALRAQVRVNPANITARRDLANVYLNMLRPRAALALIEQALARAANDPELLLLQGLALHRAGRHEQALGPLVRAVELDPRIRFGEPYRLAGDALSALGRTEAAIDAYERYVEANSSDVVAHIRLARAHAQLGDRPAAARCIADALHTWQVIGARLKRQAFFRGYLAAQWMRVWVLREPGPLLVALALVVASALLVRTSYPLVVKLVRPAHTRPLRAHFGHGVISYRGVPIKLAKNYASFESYKNDPDNIDPAELPKIERMMSEAKLGPAFEDWADFLRQQSELIFPGYGAGGGPRVVGSEREILVSSIEIPHADKERIIVLEKRLDGGLQLLDDFIASSTAAQLPDELEVGDRKLSYYNAERTLLREKNE